MPDPFHELLSTLRATHHPDVSIGEPATAEAIAEAEAELGVPFPPQYRGFLETLGDLAIAPVEIFGIAAPGPPQVVAQTLLWRGTEGVPDRAVIVEIDGLEGHPVGFVCDPGDAGEPPVHRWEPDGAVQIAVDFADYLAGVAEEIVDRPGKTLAGPIFDPPWGQTRSGGGLSPDRKEVKVAYTIVQRIKYDGASFETLVKEFNARRVPARERAEWSVDAAREAYSAWKDRY